MIPQPKDKFTQLVNTLNEMKKREYSAFELARFKKEAQSLVDSNPVDGYTALGIIACFEVNIEDMHRFHRNAIKLSNEGHPQLMNYAVSLAAHGFLEEAFHYSKIAYDKAQDVIENRKMALELLIHLSDQLELEEELFAYADAWKALTGKAHWVVDLGFDEEDDEDLQNILGKYEREIQGNRDALIKLDSKLLSEVDELIKDVRD